ncbi:AAA family ATPase [Kalaharituber pfeilii]|nr:AAA family ATPase [Kalaharituber pfeilii]
MVQCPVCGKEIPMSSINRHLDRGCEDGMGDVPSTGTAVVSPKSKSGRPVASIFQTPAKKRPAQAMGGGSGGGGSSSVVRSGTGRNPSPTTGIHGGFVQGQGQRGSGVFSKEERGGDAAGEGRAAFGQGQNEIQSRSMLDSAPPAKKQKKSSEKLQDAMPLAEKVRPKALDEICGQDLVGPEGVLRGLIEKEKVPSMILWGSAGCGKTTIARVIARRTKCRFVEISATESGVAECKKIFNEAKTDLVMTGRKTILFCDEIHRFSKSQQDVFLAPVESGQITLIGATTENPSFKVQSALLSRCRVFTLKKLTSQDIEHILRRALESESPRDEDSDKPILPSQLDDEMLSYLALFADGDARTALNLLELALSLSHKQFDKDAIKKALTRTLVYDRSGDMHYDAISAFHKSVRGSDPDAALYWLGRMLMGGEDPLYIARRMVVIASEDVGLADNTMLPLATATMTAVQQIGLPEARINLAHCAVALAEAKKSTRAYRGLNAVMGLLENDPVACGAPVPYHLRNAPTRLMKEMGYGREYKYNPDYVDGQVLQQYLPEQLEGRKFLEDQHLGTKMDPDLQARKAGGGNFVRKE